MRWMIAIVLLTVPNLAMAQEAITLRFPPPAKGDVHGVRSGMLQSLRMMRLDQFGNDLADRTTKFSSQMNYVDEYLAVEKDEPTHYRRRFETASESINDGNPTLLAIHGKTIAVDHRGGNKKITWEDGEPLSDGITRSLEEALKEGKNKLGGLASFEPLPSHPVKVGDTWTIDVTAIVKDCEAKHGCQCTGASGVGILRDIYQGPTGKCAKVEVHIRVPLHTIKSGDKVFELNDGSGTLLDGVYDFSLTGETGFYASEMRLNFLAAGTNPETDGTSTRLRMELTVNLTEQRSAGR